MARREFSEKNKIKMLLWCDRHCCLCGKQCGGNIEIHHIDKENDNTIENGIPLCFECHGLVHAYKKNPKGSGFRPKELKTRRNQIYDKCTAYLVSPLNFEITQKIINRVDGRMSIVYRPLPDAGFNITNTGNVFPMKVRVSLSIFLGKRMIEDFSSIKNYLYGGTKDWHLNPGNGVRGHFDVPREAVKSQKQLKVRIKIKIIDMYDHERNLLPVEYIYMRDKKDWYLEPSTSS